ncbi:MAG: DUF2953 domain-containing protein [Faecalibacterium sp.]
MTVILSILSALGAVLLFLLKVLLILLAVILVLILLLLLCPFCADVCWEDEQLTVRAGALGLTFLVWRYPQPEPDPNAVPQPPKGIWGKLKARFSAWRAQRKAKKAAKKPSGSQTKKSAPARKKAKLTLNILCTILRGAGRLVRAVFGALRITKIYVCLGIRGEDPADAARTCGKVNAWLYPVLGFLDRFLYLDFEELRVLPDFGAQQPAVRDRISFRVSAQAFFIVIAAVRVLYEFWREKVLDVFL